MCKGNPCFPGVECFRQKELDSFTCGQCPFPTVYQDKPGYKCFENGQYLLIFTFSVVCFQRLKFLNQSFVSNTIPQTSAFLHFPSHVMRWQTAPAPATTTHANANLATQEAVKSAQVRPITHSLGHTCDHALTHAFTCRYQ